jgi:8-oxo-dGTP diphosphatase
MEIPIGLKRHAAMVILRHEDHFLLIQRAPEPNRGKFVPVGGKLEPYESPVKAARRETREETGIVLEDLTFCGVLVESSPTSYNWTCHIYLSDVAQVQPPPGPEGTFFWVPFSELEELNTPPTDWWIYQMVARERPFVLNAEYDDQLQLLFMDEELSGERLIG